MKRLRLILGDQLNSQHSWYNYVDNNVVYLMAEMRQETDYVRHHIQKVVAFFAAMRNFSYWLGDQGHQVIYFKIGDCNNPQDLTKLIKQQINNAGADKFEYQLPDEYRLDEQLEVLCNELIIETQAVDSEHFYSHRHELSDFFKNNKNQPMESFYRMMRKKHHILMDDKTPVGGQWNFDKNNRKKWTGNPEVPREEVFSADLSGLLKEIESAGVITFGKINAKRFTWPISRTDCLQVLNFFCAELLPYFGSYQDAMHTEQKYLFHSRLSFALNSKMLSPKEVVDKVLEYYWAKSSVVEISQVEGFIRQILGWREYMRGIYWREMPNYQSCNSLGNHNKLPDFYWTGETKMNCLSKAISQSLDNAYAHHIQRLMITGNYALLTMTDPDEVDAWYLGVYIDAIEWVEITNTRGMSQYADGGIVATKPYISSANYINKMSNYCGDCQYSPGQKIGNNACPFNALYWNFLDEKKAYFNSNHRMAMMMSLLNKIKPDDLIALKKRAKDIIENPKKYH